MPWNNQKFCRFAQFVEHYFETTQSDIHKMFLEEMNASEKRFSNASIERVVDSCELWVNEPRMESITPEDLVRYRIACLFFRSIKPRLGHGKTAK